MLNPTVVIFSQGDEVISGATVDTNAARLARECRELGFNIIRHITVTDDLDDIVRAMKEIDCIADVCLSTGGLGPTQDDLTMQAYSLAFDADLQLNEQALLTMQSYFDKINRPMPEVNRKQAYLPASTEMIDNHWGTAPGFIGQGQRCLFYFMPGVPHEMKNMLNSFVKADLQARFAIEKVQLMTLRTVGLGESAIQQQLDALALPNDVGVSFRAGLAENELKLTFSKDATRVEIDALVANVKSTLGSGVFAVDGLGQQVKSLPDYVDQLMKRHGLTLRVYETLTQGLISQQCASLWLEQANVYPHTAKLLNSLKITNGEVTKKLALQCVNQIETQSKSLVLVQLYTNLDEKKVHIYTVLLGSQGSVVTEKTIIGYGQRMQVLAAASAFDLLRKYLVSLNKTVNISA